MVELVEHAHITSTTELNRAGRHLFGSAYLGTFPQDRVPPLKKGEMAIANVDTAGLPGTHWVAIAGLGKGQNLVYDSFGRASKKLLPYLAGGRNVTDTDYDAEQKKVQTSCGQYSLAWLIFLQKYGVRNAKLI